MLRGSSRAGGSPALPATCTAGSRQEPPLRSPSEQRGPEYFLEAFQAAKLAGCSACWHGHEARGRTRGRSWRPHPASAAPWDGAAKPTRSQGAAGAACVVLSTQPCSPPVSSPRQIGSHKQGKQFWDGPTLPCHAGGAAGDSPFPPGREEQLSWGNLSSAAVSTSE